MGTLTDQINRYVTGRYQRGEITRDTMRDFRWTLTGFDESFGNRPLNQLGPAAVDRWLETIGHLAAATRREYLSRVRTFTRWLVAEGKLRTDPTAHVPKIRQAKRAPRVLTEQQVGRLLRVAPDTRARAVLWLMVGCGLRCVEVARLQVEDYTGRDVIVTGKNGNERVVPVPVRVAGAVDAYLEDAGVTAGPLIRSTINPAKGLSPHTLSGYVREWMVEAEVKVRALDGRSAHALRRTCATDVARNADLRVVQQLLGHSRLETTAASYLAPVGLEEIRRAIEGRGYAEAA